MAAQLLDGKKLAEQMIVELKKTALTRPIKLVVVQAGQNTVSAKYVGEKEKAAKELGLGFEWVELPRAIAQRDLQEVIREKGKERQTTGMIVQLPLPRHIPMQVVLDEIPFEKDVDVLSSAALGAFALKSFSVLPPTVGAVKELLDSAGISGKGKTVVLIGAGRLVGLPLAIWLMQEKATIYSANEYTKDLPSVVRQADIVISGVGKANLIIGTMVKKGAVVIDAGTSVEGGKTKGDIDFDSVAKKAAYITPVPGGVGPLTVACLFRNVIALSRG